MAAKGGANLLVRGESAAAPRARILKAATEMFYRDGIHAISVDAIVEGADTNKTTFYRHFASKDELIAECLRELICDYEVVWSEIEQEHSGKPMQRLLAWLRVSSEFKVGADQRGCAFVNAAIELADAGHPARRVVEEAKSRFRQRIAELCRKAGLRDPELLADELFLLGEGARVAAQALGPHGPVERLSEMFQSLVAAHAPQGT